MDLNGNGVVLGVALLVWGLLFVYLVRLESRIKELEKR
jgi:CcmD family protein